TCLVIMLLLNMTQIISRAVIDKGISLVFPWTVFLFCWSVFFGFFVLYRQGGDITVDFFVDRFGETGRRFARHFVNLTTFALMAVMLWHGPQTLMQQIGDEIEIVQVDRWIQTLPLFLSCILVLANACLDTTKAFAGIPERTFTHSIDDPDEDS
ncbi:MAG: TRAP transporter small permease, partial [Rhodospirillaceae bacterium]